MSSVPRIHGLLRKRQAIADALEAELAQVRKLVLNIATVDATIRLFQPDLEHDSTGIFVRPNDFHLIG